MWLLDKNVPVQLVNLLNHFGIQAETAEAKGFGTLTNGDLVSAAARTGISCILTRDRLFPVSASKTLKQHDTVCVVVIKIPQLRAAAFLKEFKKAWALSPIRPVANQVIGWPADLAE